jgi:dephospho-CoA kinase
MLRLKRVAVTGSIASGKSTVCQFFEEWGAYVVRADHLLHRAFSIDTALRSRICQLFGDKILVGMEIDRTVVAGEVAQAPELLDQLEAICHPFVNREIRREYKDACKREETSLFVAEVPLLFESRWPMGSWFDATVVVVADRAVAKDRYVRSGRKDEQFDFLEARQMPPEEKRRRATYTIVNNNSLSNLKAEAQKLFCILTNP